MITYAITKSDLQSRAKSIGYCVRILDGEIECYPKGKRGDASYFETDDQDGRRATIAFMRADRDARFRDKLEAARKLVPVPDEAIEALVKWHAYHGTEWLDNLLWKGWFNGRYDGDSLYNYAGTLQQLRNINGHEFIALLK